MSEELRSKAKQTTVFLADGRPEVRSALRLVLEQEPAWKVVGEADSAEGLLDRMQVSDPDMLLLDWELPESDRCCPSKRLGERLVPTLLSHDPSLLIVAMSSRPENDRVSLDAGAHGFVCKCGPPELLLRMLRSVLSGGRR